MNSINKIIKVMINTFKKGAADMLRMELRKEAPFTKEEFIEKICLMIKAYGFARFICDRHIRETKIKNDNVLRMAHEHIAIDFARSEGFNVSYRRNSHGVRYIVFTL